MKRESKSMEENEGLVSEPSSESIRQGLKARQLEMCRVISPNEVPKLLGDARTLVLVYCRDATHKVMQRGIPMNSGLDGLDSVGLVNRLWEVANNELMDWLIIPLLNGIIKGGNAMNKKIAAFGDLQPILHWLCQYKNWCRQKGYCGGDDMVALALQAGADVNMEANNKTTPIFFAVKYASARCVEMLLDAGTNIKQKDIYGQTIWKNAVERPDPKIIELLIKRCNGTIPVSEQRFKVVHSRDNTKICGQDQWLVYHLPDHMLSLYGGMLNSTDGDVPLSWCILGDPDIEDLAVALVRVMQAGARFSPTNASLLKLLNTKDPLSGLGADPLSKATHVDSYISRLMHCNYDKFQYDIICLLRDVIFGRKLPKTIQPEIDVADQDYPEPNDTCPICLSDMDSSDAQVTLYCGHRYCVECIQAYGKCMKDDVTIQGYRSGDDIVVTGGGNRKDDKRCPICRRLLCGDLLSQANNAIYRQRTRFGIDRHEASELIMGARGPELLTDEQLRFECNAIGRKLEGSRSDLLKDLKNFTGCNKMGKSEWRGDDGLTIPLDMDEMKVELSASASIICGGNNPTHICAPETGPVVVPIEVKGISILAWLSPHSFVTVIPMDVVKTFGLKTKPISSSQFMAFNGNPVSISAVVDEFTFYIGSVEVCLNNAIVLGKETSVVRGVQLGMDFFESALWTRCSTRISGDSFVITDGGYTNNVFLSDQPDELRYYSRGGRICQLPFIHITNLATSALIPIVTLSGDLTKIDFGECQWCCRYFPCDGMLPCDHGLKKHYYCDEGCKAKGMAVRDNMIE